MPVALYTLHPNRRAQSKSQLTGAQPGCEESAISRRRVAPGPFRLWASCPEYHPWDRIRPMCVGWWSVL